jgi:hypothetical protein
VIQNEIQTIVASLRPEDRDYIRALSEDRLILLHPTLGLNLRNAFRANTYPYLFSYCDRQESPETRSFDSISATAIKHIWEHLRNANSNSLLTSLYFGPRRHAYK